MAGRGGRGGGGVGGGDALRGSDGALACALLDSESVMVPTSV